MTTVNSSSGVRIHELKTWPEYFQSVYDGVKNFEIRKNDRSFQKGDLVILKEWDPNALTEKFGYTGREIKAEIGYVLSNFQKEGFVAFSLLNVENL